MNASLRVILVLATLCSGALAAVVQTPRPALAADEVAAVELAGWIRDRRPGLLLLDTRAADAFEHDRLPAARPLAGIEPAALNASATVVVYAERRVDAAVAEALRRRSGAARVLRLHGGVAAWNDDVLFPAIRADASAAQRLEFVRRSHLSRYFGGTPRVLDPGVAPDRGRSRRGC